MYPHLDHLYRFAYRMTGTREDAEDLVQDLLVKLYPRLAELRAVERLRPWLTRVLYRLGVDRARSRSRNPLALCDDGGADDTDIDPVERLHSHEPEPSAALEQHWTQARLLDALQQLSLEHRSVITLHMVEGYALNELEDLLQTPVGTLKSRLHRARAQLKALLQREPDPDHQRVNPRGQRKWNVVK